MTDRTNAEALRIAHEICKSFGWKFTPQDVAKIARDIIKAMEPKP